MRGLLVQGVSVGEEADEEAQEGFFPVKGAFLLSFFDGVVYITRLHPTHSQKVI